MHECAASLERYRAKKTTRQSGGSKIRYQIRKTNADNRLRFKVPQLNPVSPVIDIMKVASHLHGPVA